ncbi:hypothetical protein M3202_15020 [Alkalihalobacillus oceani]|uniref:Uncharacterized protein n=1 Tax=Halalkalibacter oceani TaxID=1653776 RepID=A0A9X2DS12_9BACI|nr:hypothetical protein [Halalkalibacter oceani]MCM3715382.1 hypothetical protein [Halalkalibacter oceani]
MKKTLFVLSVILLLFMISTLYFYNEKKPAEQELLLYKERVSQMYSYTLYHQVDYLDRIVDEIGELENAANAEEEHLHLHSIHQLVDSMTLHRSNLLDALFLLNDHSNLVYDFESYLTSFQTELKKVAERQHKAQLSQIAANIESDVQYLRRVLEDTLATSRYQDEPLHKFYEAYRSMWEKVSEINAGSGSALRQVRTEEIPVRTFFA